MKNIVTLALLIFFGASVSAQKYKVPNKIEFAGMMLSLDKGGQEEVQKYVDQLTHNDKFQKKYVDLADIYFPIIEEVFNELNFPEDFKYLAIQESALNGQAVSSSNAVGYWQMKEASATEVGLIINNTVDERKNIVSASRGAARYITKNNAKLKNWVYALNAYYLGPKGVLKEVKSKYIGANEMEITKNTHWYILKFLAHKIAFEQEVKRNISPLVLVVEESQGNSSLKDYAKKHDIAQEQMELYNPWISYSKKIPTDHSYPVILPLPNKGQQLEPVNASGDEIVVSNSKKDPEVKAVFFEKPEYNIKYVVNKVPAIVAKEGDNSSTLAIKGDITKERLVKYNDIETFTEIKIGHTYYLRHKKNKALVAYHVVQYGETLWEISQMYAIKERAIRSKNRMEITEALQPGRVLWLQKKRPNSEPVEIRKLLQPLEDNRDSSTTKGSLADKEKFLADETKPASKDPVIEEVQKEIQVSTEEKAVEDELPVDHKPRDIQDEIENSPKSETTETMPVGEAQEEIVEAPAEVIIVPETIKTNQVEEVTEEELVEPEKIPSAKAKEHMVEVGETLYGISRKYNVSAENLINENNLSSTSLSAGMILKIPSEQKENVEVEPIKPIADKTKNTETVRKPKPSEHLVEVGETLYGISRKYDVPVEVIKTENGLTSNSLSAGMILKIPSEQKEKDEVEIKKDEPVYHTVKQGETLYRISKTYDADVDQLKTWNDLKSNEISVGQKLRVK